MSKSKARNALRDFFRRLDGLHAEARRAFNAFADADVDYNAYRDWCDATQELLREMPAAVADEVMPTCPHCSSNELVTVFHDGSHYCMDCARDVPGLPDLAEACGAEPIAMRMWPKVGYPADAVALPSDPESFPRMSDIDEWIVRFKGLVQCSFATVDGRYADMIGPPPEQMTDEQQMLVNRICYGLDLEYKRPHWIVQRRKEAP